MSTYEKYTIAVYTRLPDSPDGLGHNIWIEAKGQRIVNRKTYDAAIRAYDRLVAKWSKRPGQHMIEVEVEFQNQDDRFPRRRTVKQVTVGKRPPGHAKPINPNNPFVLSQRR